MEVINKVSQHDTGYKKWSNEKVGQFAMVDHNVIKADKEALEPSHKLIYAYIRYYRDRKTNTTTISWDKLVQYTGYKRDTINEALKRLDKYGFIKKQKSIKKGRNSGWSYNIFTFPDQDPSNWERINLHFLSNKHITKEEKAFILLLMPSLLPNDCIGSLTKPVGPVQISEIIEVSEPTVRKRIKSLMDKGIMEDYQARISGTCELEIVGYKFNMEKIMYSAADGLLEQVIDLQQQLFETTCHAPEDSYLSLEKLRQHHKVSGQTDEPNAL